ncbi:MAG: cytochrome c [Dokdonella sp.]
MSVLTSNIAGIGKLTGALALVASLAIAGSAFAAGDIENGKKLATTCQACHGADGAAKTDPQYPRLAGQYPDYLARALHEYKAGDRKNPIMATFATNLSEQDMKDLAAYFSALPSVLTDLHGHMQGD